MNLRPPLPACRTALAVALLCVAAGWPAAARAACLDESAVENTEPATPAAPADPTDPRRTLQAMVREALERSQQVGASRLLAQAALDDGRETAAAQRIQASMSLGAGPGGTQSLAGSETSALQLRSAIRQASSH